MSLRTSLCLATVGIALVACKNDAPPTVIVPSATPAPEPSIRSVPIASASAAASAEPVTDICQSDTDCVLSTFPGCCTCCECGKIHASTKSADAAQRDACTRKDCPSCDNLDYKCIPCKDPAKEGMRARCQSGACVLVETSSPPAPAAIACKTTDDCWYDERYQPIARPKNLRGKKLVPCKDGEHAPLCEAGRCAVQAYRC